MILSIIHSNASRYIIPCCPSFINPVTHTTERKRPFSSRNTCFSSLNDFDSTIITNTTPTSINTPKIPLSQRPANYTASLSELVAWRDAASLKISSIAQSWEEEDGGPSTQELQTELSWLIEDTVAAIAPSSSTLQHASSTDNNASLMSPSLHEEENSLDNTSWKEMTWREIERNIDAYCSNAIVATHTQGSIQDPPTLMLRLREPLAELDRMWNERITQRTPLQYLTASAFWRDVVLSVGQGVLIPRPETELMIDFVKEIIHESPHLACGEWADMGTGSGALAIGIARAVPAVRRVWAVDLAEEPALHAAFNAERLGVDDKVRVVRGSWYEPLEAAGVRTLCGIVSNPPYISQDELHGLQAEVGLHEPQLALSGGDGLGVDALIPICLGAVRFLQPGGFLALETAGGEQAEYIAHLLSHLTERHARGVEYDGNDDDEESLAFSEVMIKRDLRGVDRFVVAVKS